MNLIFNLTIRTPLENVWDTYETADKTCARCNGCVKIEMKNISWNPRGMIKLESWEADHTCVKFNTVIDIYNSEDPEINCSKFTYLEYKKL
jgi:hypothetical protein